MAPQITSLFSLLFALLLPQTSLFYSLKNCTIDFDDHSKVVCDFMKLTSIPSDVPKNITSFSAFYNKIQRIRGTDLTGFTRLEFLHLGHNYISDIEDGSFSDLSAVTDLLLSFNKLVFLTDSTFKGLFNLARLWIACNQIVSISKFAFEPLKNLQEIDLSCNKISQIENIGGVLNCPLLKTLDLTYNQITSFESDHLQFPLNITHLYFNTDSLVKFSIHSNVIPSLKSLFLSDVGPAFDWDISDKSFLKSVTTLVLSDSKLNFEMYKLIFQSVFSVENLYLADIGRFFDKGLVDIACGIPSLKLLDLTSNDISEVNDSLLQFCTNLTELDLSQNVITDLTEASLQKLTHLSRLKLEDNELSRIPLTICNMTSLTYLSFKSNYITELTCSDLMNLPFLTELNLKSNKISSLKSCAFKHLSRLMTLNVENNYIFELKDINVPSLVSLNVNGNNVGWIQRGAFWNMPSLTDLQAVSGRETSFQRGAFEGLLNLKRLSFSPPLSSQESLSDLAQLESLVLIITQDDGRNVQDNKPLFVHLPALKALSIKSNNEYCINWSQYVLYHLDNLQEMLLDKVCCDLPDTFQSSPHLKKLQMINCDALTMDPDLFQPITGLQILDMSKNALKSLDFLVEANLTKLEKLVLNNNEFKVINETVFEALPSLKYLDLSGNPFVCNCSNVGFIEWAIRNKQVQVVNAFQYRCSSPLSEEGHFLLDFNVQSCWEFTGFLCFLSTSALVLLTLLSSFIYHLLRWQLVYGYYLLLAFLYDSKKRRQGCPHIYDAFVSYNVHDEEWVYRELVPELEGRQGWRLCLHQRDFVPGKSIINSITDAIYSSRKTLCVISRRYLQSEWCSREIQLASFRLFDERKDVLILLFLEEISSNQLSPFYRMRKLVKSRTYLSWTQARSHKALFWEKVHRAMETGNEPGDNNNPLTANV